MDTRPDDLDELINLADLSPTDIASQVTTWSHGDKKKALAMLDGYVTRATMSTKPKFLVARKLLQQGE